MRLPTSVVRAVTTPSKGATMRLNCSSALKRSTTPWSDLTSAIAELWRAKAVAKSAFLDSRSWSDTTPFGESRQRS
jgi:hypothetical protein